MLTGRLIFIFFILLPVFSAATAFSDDYPKPTEYEVKAAYIYNFAKFVRWPQNAFSDGSDKIHVCVLGDDPFGSSLSTIEGKTAVDRKIGVRRIASLQNARGCEIIFISGSEAERVRQIMKTLDSLPVLTVGDTEGFAEQGIMINFYMEKNTVRFEINLKAATRAGLRLSSSLLRIARIVEE